jgi:hypothetical protein
MAAGFLAFPAGIDFRVPGAFFRASLASFGAQAPELRLEDGVTAHQIRSQGAQIGAILAEPDAFVETGGPLLVLAGLGAMPAFEGACDEGLDGVLHFLVGFSYRHANPPGKAKGTIRRGPGGPRPGRERDGFRSGCVGVGR